MIPGQDKFQEFLMSMVLPGNESAAQDIITQYFTKMETAPLTSDEIDAAVAQFTPLINPNSVPELQQAANRMKEMSAFGGQPDMAALVGQRPQFNHEPGDHPHFDHGPGEYPHEFGHDHFHDASGTSTTTSPDAPSAQPATPADAN